MTRAGPGSAFLPLSQGSNRVEPLLERVRCLPLPEEEVGSDSRSEYVCGDEEPPSPTGDFTPQVTLHSGQ